MLFEKIDLEILLHFIKRYVFLKIAKLNNFSLSPTKVCYNFKCLKYEKLQSKYKFDNMCTRINCGCLQSVMKQFLKFLYKLYIGISLSPSLLSLFSLFFSLLSLFSFSILQCYPNIKYLIQFTTINLISLKGSTVIIVIGIRSWIEMVPCRERNVAKCNYPVDKALQSISCDR